MEKLCEEGIRFARILYGTLGLIGFFVNNIWFIFAGAILMILGGISPKLNLFYHLYLSLRKMFTKKPLVFLLDPASNRFACFLGGIFYLLAFFLYSLKFFSVAWIFTWIVVVLSYLAGFTGICVGAIIYALFIKAIKK